MEWDMVSELQHTIGEVADAITGLRGQKPQQIFFLGNWVCPKCGVRNASTWTPLELRNGTPNVTYCEVESGGCNQRVVLNGTMSVDVAVSLVSAPCDQQLPLEYTEEEG